VAENAAISGANELPPAPPPPPTALTAENAAELWSQAVSQCSGMLAENAKQARDVAITAPNRLAVCFESEYTFAKSMCERPESTARLKQVLAELTGTTVGIEFRVTGGNESPAERAPAARSVSPRQRLIDVAEHPMVRRAHDLFGAEPTRVIDPPKG
jgi:hypothetical protein